MYTPYWRSYRPTSRNIPRIDPTAGWMVNNVLRHERVAPGMQNLSATGGVGGLGAFSAVGGSVPPGNYGKVITDPGTVDGSGWPVEFNTTSSSPCFDEKNITTYYSPECVQIRDFEAQQTPPVPTPMPTPTVLCPAGMVRNTNAKVGPIGCIPKRGNTPCNAAGTGDSPDEVQCGQGSDAFQVMVGTTTCWACPGWVDNAGNVMNPGQQVDPNAGQSGTPWGMVALVGVVAVGLFIAYNGQGKG
jgi:hypothetical protein